MDSNNSFNPRRKNTVARPGSARGAVLVVALAGAGLAALPSCGSSTSTDLGSGSSSGSASGNGGSTSGASGSFASGSNSGGGGSGASSGGGSGNGASGGNGSGSNTGSASGANTGSSSGASTGAASGGGSSGGGSGSSASGSSGASGGDGGAVGTCVNTNMSQINVDASGWVCNNKWGIQGAWYCYNDMQETSPSCKGQGDIPYLAGKGMCLSGATAAGSTFGAGVGFVLAQPNPTSAAKPNYNAQAQNIVGFAVTITGTSGGSVLNVSFPGSATNAKGEAPFVTVPGVNNATVTYNVLFADARITNQLPVTLPSPTVDPTKITDVKVVIPNDKTVHAYNFCITSVVPLTAPPSGSPACGTQYGPVWDNGSQFVVGGLGNVALQNDPFDAAHHVAVTSFGGGTCAGFTASATWGGGAVEAFPSLVYGYALGGKNDGNFYGGYTGGKTIGAIQSAKTSWTWSGSASQYDAAYDVWFAPSANPQNPGTELMVWLGKGSNNPLGSNSGATLSAWGTTFSVWTNGTNPTGQPVVSYVSSGTQMSVSGQDLEVFFKDAATHAYASLSNGSYLLGIQAGFEMYSGSFTTSSYSVNVQ